MEELYIKLLCKKVEQRYGHPLDTTDDFVALSEDIDKVVNERLSVSTLKRCFGRVNANLIHRNTTLSILARYTGFRDWAEFANTLRTSLNEESDFKSINAISTEKMPIGCELKISWLPDREITVRHIGESRFLILDAKNTKLYVNDIIEIALLAPNEPMFISKITRNERFFTGYLAGQLHGVNVEVGPSHRD